MTSKKTWAVLAFLLYAALQFFYLDKYPLPWGDEFFYTDPSWHFLSKGTFANTLYPPYVHYDVTNVVYGRVFLFINALIFFLFDYSLFTIRLQPLLMGFLALFLTFKVCDRMFGRTGAWIAAGLLSFSAMFIHGSHSGRPEMTVAVLTLLSLFLFQKGEEKSRYYFFAGLAATLAVDVHPPSGIVAPGGLCFLLAVRFAADRARKKTWNWRMVLAAGSGMALGALWWLAVHVLIHPELYREQMELNKRVQVPMWDRSLLYIFKKEALRYYGFFWQGRYHRNMLFFCALILSLAWIARRRRPKDAEFLAYLAGAASALLTVAVNSFPYYLVAVYPLFCAAAGTALSDWAGSRRSFPRKAGIALGLALAALYALETGYWAYHFRKADYAGYLAKLRAHVPPGRTLMVSSPVWIGFFRTQPTFTDNYFEMISTKYKDGTPSYPEEVMDRMGRNFGEVFDNLGIEVYVEDSNVFFWEEQPETIRFMKDRARLVAVIEDPVYGRDTFYPGTKRSFVYRILPGPGEQIKKQGG
ncbi:MAG: hypothetical protein A2636_00610 [Elusimicrobia bacterium RIFCSPHIGHO2_01_FULL_64_10]|nr:MAG: hypothetical protein A2636_00610 [Elusimicrobia bacterium RIFCSPHIGHO2_01_FULL_64_10]